MVCAVGLNGFETLGLRITAECAKCELRDLLSYLGAFDNANNTVSVLWSGGIEPRIIVEGIVSNDNVRKQFNLKFVRFW